MRVAFPREAQQRAPQPGPRQLTLPLPATGPPRAWGHLTAVGPAHCPLCGGDHAEHVSSSRSECPSHTLTYR